MDHARQDIRYALRVSRRSPRFAFIAVATLSVAVGAATSIFSVVNAVLLRPLPYANAERLVEIVENVSSSRTDGAGPRREPAMDIGTVAAFRGHTRTLSHVGIREPIVATLSAPDGPVRLSGFRLSADYFSMLGVQPFIGHVFEGPHPNPEVAVLSHAAWLRFFGGSADVVGRTVSLDGKAYSVLGVMPREFAFPDTHTQFWIPWTVTEPELRSRVPIVARIKAGISMEAAGGEVDAILSQLRGMGVLDAAGGDRARFALISVQNQLVEPMRPSLRLLAVASGVVLLVACVNVANLLLVRMHARRRELAIRSAVGASRGRLIRQMLIEGVVLAVPAAVAGTAIAWAGVRMLRTLALNLSRRDLGSGVSIPRLEEIGIDVSAWAFAVALSVLVTLLAGLLSAFRDSGRESVDALRDSAGATISGFSLFRRQRLQGALLVTQVTLATAMTVGASLLTTSGIKLLNVDTGYDTSNILTFQVGSPRDAPWAADFSEDFIARLRTMPGINGAGFAGALPMVQTLGSVPLRTSRESQLPGRMEAPSFSERLPPDRPSPRYVSRDFLSVMGTRLVAGRGFGDGDRAGQPRVMLVNETVARSGVLGPNPIGKRVYAIGNQPWEVVGIVEDTRQLGLHLEPNPQIFMDFRQLPGILGSGGIEDPYFAVRTAIAPSDVVATIRGIIRQLDPLATLDNVATMDQIVSHSISRRRMITTILIVFAAVAVALAAAGIYGVVAFAVGERRREIGIRMALGARTRQVVGLVMGQVATLAGIGVIVGLAAAAALTQFISSLLFGVTPLDPPTFAAAAALVAVVSSAAAFGPARSATKVPAMAALRSE